MKLQNPQQIQKWANQFRRDGVLVIPGVLSRAECDELKYDIDQLARSRNQDDLKSRNVYIYKRLFESSEANLRLFEKEPIVTLAEEIINDPTARKDDNNFTSTGLQCHVIHNNGLIVPAGKPGIYMWHQDDPPHFIVTHGKAPTNIHLPVLTLTVNYYLTDVNHRDNGPTRAVKGSHLFGALCPEKPPKKDVTYCTGPAGSAVLFICQVWHSGSSNRSTQPRYVSQITYARRLIGHKYYPFMNYQMPDHVVEMTKSNKRLKRLTGFLDHGAYG